MRVILTAAGRNRIGVLAELTTTIASQGGNILDIGQKIVGEYFSTLMVIELPANQSFLDFKHNLEKLGGEGDYRVWVQHEKVFHSIHRI